MCIDLSYNHFDQKPETPFIRCASYNAINFAAKYSIYFIKLYKNWSKDNTPEKYVTRCKNIRSKKSATQSWASPARQHDAREGIRVGASTNRSLERCQRDLLKIRKLLQIPFTTDQRNMLFGRCCRWAGERSLKRSRKSNRYLMRGSVLAEFRRERAIDIIPDATSICINARNCRPIRGRVGYWRNSDAIYCLNAIATAPSAPGCKNHNDYRQLQTRSCRDIF